MDYSFLAIGLLFAASTAGIPLYSFITKKHFVRLRAHFIVQGLFWLMIGSASVYGAFNAVDTLSLILNSVLVIVSFLFGSYAISMVFKDRGAFILPYAKLNNNESFMEYVSGLDVEKIQIRTMSGNRYDIVEFVDVEENQETQIKDQISSNTDLVIAFGTNEAYKRLMKSFTFALFIIALAFLL